MEIILIGLVILGFFSCRLRKKNLCILGAGYLFLIPASRCLLANGDVVNYIRRYETLSSRSYMDLFQSWRIGNLKDFGFYVVAKVFADSHMSYQVWIGTIAFLFAAAVMYFIYKNSENVFQSIVILLAMYFHFTLSGLRQTVALAFILIAYQCILDNKLKRFLMIVVLASCFHSTAILALPAYWIAKMKIGKKQWVMLIASFFITIFNPAFFRKLIVMFSWNEAINGYAERTITLSWSGFIIQLTFLIFLYVFKKNIPRQEEVIHKKLDVFFNLMVIGAIFQGFATVVAEAFRISYYYSLCSIAAIPCTIQSQKNYRNRYILFFGMTSLFIIYILMNNVYRTYTYFWIQNSYY